VRPRHSPACVPSGVEGAEALQRRRHLQLLTSTHGVEGTKRDRLTSAGRRRSTGGYVGH
jgi:hypothetical protein